MAICAIINTSVWPGNLIQVAPDLPVNNTCPYILLTGTEYQSSAVFDYALAAQIWTFAITAVVTCYLVSHYAGAIVRMIKQIFGIR